MYLGNRTLVIDSTAYKYNYEGMGGLQLLITVVRIRQEFERIF